MILCYIDPQLERQKSVDTAPPKRCGGGWWGDDGEMKVMMSLSLSQSPAGQPSCDPDQHPTNGGVGKWGFGKLWRCVSWRG